MLTACAIDSYILIIFSISREYRPWYIESILLNLRCLDDVKFKIRLCRFLASIIQSAYHPESIHLLCVFSRYSLINDELPPYNDMDAVMIMIRGNSCQKLAKHQKL